MRRRKGWAALALLCVSAGCVGTDEVYVRADRMLYDAIAPEYLGYVDVDGSLSVEQRARRHRTVEAWDDRLRRLEGAR